MPEPKVLMSVLMPLDTRKELEWLSENLGVSMTEAIIMALDAMYQREGGPQ